MVVFLKHQIRNRLVLVYSLIIAEDVLWAFQRNTKHVHLVSKPLRQLNSIFHYCKLTVKSAGLESVLPLSVPHNWGTVTEDQYTSLRTSCHSTSGQVGIYKTMSGYSFTSCFWHVIWYGFFCVAIEALPVMFLKHVFVYPQMRWVKIQL